MMMGMHIIDEQEDELGTPSSSSCANDSTNTTTSSSSDFLDDATSSSSSSSSSSSTFSPSDKQLQKNPLYQMSDLMEELPIKRGLSRYFQGKSQSFSSLSNARRLEDLMKPQAKPCKKRLKSCKSHGAGLDHTTTKPLSPNGCCSRIISKKPPSSTAMGKRYHHHHHNNKNIGFHGGRAPTHHHHHCSSNPSAHALLIA